MNRWTLKIRHKFLLLMLFLVMVVSAPIFGFTKYLSNDGKEKVLKGVSQKLGALQNSTIKEFSKFTKLSNEAIMAASGLLATDRIVSAAEQNQREFNIVIEKAIGEVGNNVAFTMNSEKAIISKGMDELLSNSTDSMNDIMEFDMDSMNVLANVTTFNINSLKTSSMDSLLRLSSVIASLEQKFQAVQDQDNDDIDAMLVKIIQQLENPSQQQSESLLSYIVTASEDLKLKSEKRKLLMYKTLVDDFDLNAKVIKEELKLVAQKVHYAIARELENANIIQSEKIEGVIETLLNNQARIENEINKSSGQLRLAINEVRTGLPAKLKERGDEGTKNIKKRIANASRLLKKAEIQVAEKVGRNTADAKKRFQASLSQTKGVIENTLKHTSNKTVRYSAIIAIIGVIVALILGFFITQTITDPLTDAIKLTEKMAKGDFTQTLETIQRDEIGQLQKAMKTMAERLGEIVYTVSETTDEVNLAAVDISTAVQQQTSIANEQSTSISEINTTISELTQSSSQIADNAAAVSGIATNTLRETEKGAAAVNALVVKMDEIKTDNKTSINEIIKLEEKSKAITRLMEIITHIADQTKLLAFNAALEASDAGEQGKRFGVVATEIRRLADSVTESTGEIESNINEIQEAFKHLVIASEKGARNIQEGMEASSHTAVMLEDTLTAAQTTENAAKQISLSTQQQKSASEKMANALGEIAEGARQISDSLTQINGITQNLSGQSSGLRKLVGKFRFK